jgi:folate-dependent phosphoribosylglycinamide formyltransferase PurN
MNNSKNIIVFCPNPYSLYTNSVCELLINKGYKIDCIVVRKFTLNRFFQEFSRDGIRLIRKIWTKLVLKEKGYAENADNIVNLRLNENLKIKNIKEFEKQGTKIITCHTLNDQIVLDTLNQYANKIVVFTGGGIIRKPILDAAGDGIINCHMGVLPKYKGMDLPEWCVLENQIDQLGFTLHFMDTGIDTGNILKIENVSLNNYQDIKQLRSNFEPKMTKAMVDVVDQWIQGSIKSQMQDAKLTRQYFIVHPELYKKINLKLLNKQT